MSWWVDGFAGGRVSFWVCRLFGGGVCKGSACYRAHPLLARDGRRVHLHLPGNTGRRMKRRGPGAEAAGHNPESGDHSEQRVVPGKSGEQQGRVCSVTKRRQPTQ